MTAAMHAMRHHRGGTPLRYEAMPAPVPGPGQLLLKVAACAVCRTDLHIVDGELAGGRLPVVPGHEIIGTVVELGPGTSCYRTGERVGVPWLGRTCGHCRYCLSGRENLCDSARFTGFDMDGGYASYTVAEEAFCFPIPSRYDDLHAAPLLCAGLIGYRALKLAGDARRVGLYGFGAAAHIIAQVAVQQGREVYAFTRPGDSAAQALALRLGCRWAGGSDDPLAEPLDAGLIFAPVGALVPTALKATVKGGCVVCAGIHMSDIPAFPYDLLWGERAVRSVANLTRRDGEEFMALAAGMDIRTEITRYALADANHALADLRTGRLTGAAVLVP